REQGDRVVAAEILALGEDPSVGRLNAEGGEEAARRRTHLDALGTLALQRGGIVGVDADRLEKRRRLEVAVLRRRDPDADQVLTGEIAAHGDEPALFTPAERLQEDRMH